MRGMEIRQAIVAHANEIARVHTRSFLTAYDHLPLTRRSTESGFEGRVRVWQERLGAADVRTLVALADGDVVGFVYLGPDADDERVGHIHSIHVDPEHTGKGVGTELVAAAQAALVEDGYRTATLWALADNRRTQSFYEHLGWRPDGGRRRERLAVGQEDGDEVEVVRYRISLDDAEALA